MNERDEFFGQVFRELRYGEVVGTSVVPCVTCGEPHKQYAITGPNAPAPQWHDPRDGHAYRPDNERVFHDRALADALRPESTP